MRIQTWYSADDTSILIAGSNKMDFEENNNQTFQNINNWFNNNHLALNLNKTKLLEFKTNHFSTDSIQTDYNQSL
jgi:sulfate adenylyltransferase subunit 1 (EFTu-like GTPase family)